MHPRPNRATARGQLAHDAVRAERALWLYCMATLGRRCSSACAGGAIWAECALLLCHVAALGSRTRPHAGGGKCAKAVGAAGVEGGSAWAAWRG